VTLDELRQQIDLIDNQLIELLNQRMDVVRLVGELKKSGQTLIYRPEREKEIVDRLSGLSGGLLNKKAIESIFLEIFAVSRNLEMPERVGFLGPEGSFTHQAAESRFGAMSDYIPLANIRSVFEAVATSKVRFGVVPIENNQEGSVNEAIDGLADFDLNIVAELSIPVHFCFASAAEKIQNIKRIYSKDIAFKQCAGFLKDLFGEEVELIPISSTSYAAKMAMEDLESAAVCSHVAAKIHHLPILFDNIENSEQNQTRFLILAKNFINQESGHDKTSIIARLSDSPGSLADFLQDFNKAGINLSKIESRPAKNKTGFQYLFYIDFEGHYQQAHIKTLLEKHEKEVKWLGSYVKNS